MVEAAKPVIGRLDHQIIFNLVQPGSRVLDLGCGGGDLLHLLTSKKDVKGQGIEISEEAIYQCVEKGLNVFHSDIDSGLPEYPNQSFDVVILNQSLQECKKVEWVFREALRVGKNVIVGFSNFAYYKSRLMLFMKGRAPITASLPYRWFDSPNLHFLSISDFEDYCKNRDIRILARYYLENGRRLFFKPNFFASNGIYVIAK